MSAILACPFLLWQLPHPAMLLCDRLPLLLPIMRPPVSMPLTLALNDLLPGSESCFISWALNTESWLCPTSHKSFWNIPVGFCFYPLLSTAQTSPRNLVGQEAIHYISAHFSLSPTAASTLIRVSSPSYRTKASRFRNGTNWYRTGRMGSMEEDESCS